MTYHTAIREAYERNGYTPRIIFPVSWVTYESLNATPGFLIDVGCDVGNWSAMMRAIFPHAPILMVDGDPRYTVDPPVIPADATFVHACLASQAGTATFYQMQDGTAGSSLYEENSDYARRAISVETRTLDSLFRVIPDGIWLKLDVQGAELDVLRGAPEVLKHTVLVQAEFPAQEYNRGAPGAPILETFLEENGFKAISNQTDVHLDIHRQVAQYDRIFVKPEELWRS